MLDCRVSIIIVISFSLLLQKLQRIKHFKVPGIYWHILHNLF